jgi:hypothetical protein
MKQLPNSFTQLQLFRRNPDLQQLLTWLRFELQEAKRPADEILLDDADLQQLLKVSKRTTANYRSQGVLPYYWLGGKIFYLLSDVLAAIKQNKIPAIHEKVRIGK